MEQKVIELIASILCKNQSEITLESNFVTDLNADSLDILEMLMSLEEQLNIVIKDKDIVKIKTVGDIISYIQANT